MPIELTAGMQGAFFCPDSNVRGDVYNDLDDKENK